MDPFCGRGTTLLEATLRGREALGFDLLATARALSSVKVQCARRNDVLAEIEAMKLDGEAPEVPPEFVSLYHPDTWREVWSLRQSPRSATLTALALGRLHGHSSGFFSAFTFNVISLPPASLARQLAKHGSELPRRDVKRILAGAAHRFVPEGGLSGRGRVDKADARVLPLPDASVDLVITSPPFLDVIDYPDVNWVREWFMGEPGNSDAEPFVFSNRDAYATFIRDVLRELRRVVRPGGTVVFEVGPVKRESRMHDIVTTAAGGLLEVKEVVVNSFAVDELAKRGRGRGVSKISRAMRSSDKVGEETTTTKNQCVVLHRPES